MKRFLIVLLFAVPAAAQPFVLAPQSPVSAPRMGLAPASYGTMRIASDGTNFLLVWSDDRASLPAHTDFLHRQYSTFMTRVDGQGNVLDVPNIALPGFGEAWPFWDGREYVIAGSAGKYVRMSAAGEMLDPAPRTINSMPRGTIVNMVWSGERLLVAGRKYRVPDELYLTMYDRLFNVVRGEFLFDSSQSSLGNMAMATNGRDFLIVRNPCDGNCSLNIAALDREGSVVRRAPPSLGYLYGVMAIASDGNGYLLVHDTPKSVYGQWNYAADLVDASGNIHGSAGPFGPNNIVSFSPGFALAWEGDGYQFVYSRGTFDVVPGDDQYVLRAMTLDAAGKSPDYVGTALESLLHRPIPTSVAAFGTPGKHLVMTLGPDSYAPSDPVLWKGRIYDSPAHYATAPAFAVGQGVLPQESPASATAGDVSLLAWREADKGNLPFALHAARVDSHGRTLDATPLQLASATCDGSTPRVATDGRDFLVAWQEPAGVKAMRIGRDGGLLDATPITIFTDDKQRCSATSRPAISWNGSDYLVAWAGAGVSAVRVGPDGTLRDAVPMRVASDDGLANANATSDGKDFFVAWETPQNAAFGARVTAAGNASAATSLGVAHPSLILWTGMNYAVLSADSGGTRAVRVDRDGQLVDQQPFDFAATIDSRDAQGGCDARGCYAYGLTDGIVIGTRIDETPSGLVATSTPLARTDGTWQQLIVFGPGRTQFAYLAPYLGSYHLFTTQLLPARGRALR